MHHPTLGLMYSFCVCFSLFKYFSTEWSDVSCLHAAFNHLKQTFTCFINNPLLFYVICILLEIIDIYH